MTDSLDLVLIRQLAARHGLKVLGLLNHWELQIEQDRLREWQLQGYSAEMTFMQRDPTIFTSLNEFLPGIKSIVCFAIDYAAWPVATICPPGFGRVARYAWGIDYHKVLKEKLQLVLEDINADGTICRGRIFSDAVPLLERALGRQAGLGFVGKNTMLIRPGQGSFFFLAELLLDRTVHDGTKQTDLKKGSCGSCQRCISNCPTRAIVTPFKIDSRRCISYLTIEKRGVLNDWERQALGDWVFGCDICQEVCPFNHAELKRRARPLSDFEPLSFLKDGLIDLRQILSLHDDRQFKQIFGKSALTRTRRSGLIRNALCVCANQSALQLVPELLNFMENEPVAELRRQCADTLFQLAKKCDNRERVRINARLEKCNRE